MIFSNGFVGLWIISNWFVDYVDLCMIFNIIHMWQQIMECGEWERLMSMGTNYATFDKTYLLEICRIMNYEFEELDVLIFSNDYVEFPILKN